MHVELATLHRDGDAWCHKYVKCYVHDSRIDSCNDSHTTSAKSGCTCELAAEELRVLALFFWSLILDLCCMVCQVKRLPKVLWSISTHDTMVP